MITAASAAALAWPNLKPTPSRIYTSTGPPGRGSAATIRVRPCSMLARVFRVSLGAQHAAGSGRSAAANPSRPRSEDTSVPVTRSALRQLRVATVPGYDSAEIEEERAGGLGGPDPGRSG
jgi:hypothetical protein